MNCRCTREVLPDGGIRVSIFGMRLVSESNARQHWTKKHARTANRRSLVGMIVRTKIGRVTYPVRVDLTYHNSRRIDPGNIGVAFKAVQDGIADAIGVDDGNLDFYDWHYHSSPDAPRNGTWVEIVFRER